MTRNFLTGFSEVGQPRTHHAVLLRLLLCLLVASEGDVSPDPFVTEPEFKGELCFLAPLGASLELMGEPEAAAHPRKFSMGINQPTLRIGGAPGGGGREQDLAEQGRSDESTRAGPLTT